MALIKKSDTAGAALDNPLATCVVNPAPEYLPHFKLPFAVESFTYNVMGADGMAVSASATGRMCISSGGSLVKLSAPLLLTCILGRGATRKTVEGADGKKSYNRTYASLNGAASPGHAAALAANDPGLQVGNSYLLAIFQPNGVILALLDAFKSQTDYWRYAMTAGLFKDKQGVTILLDDHNINNRAGKQGTYFDPRKFTQWSKTKLSDSQIHQVVDTMRAKEAMINDYTSK